MKIKAKNINKSTLQNFLDTRCTCISTVYFVYNMKCVCKVSFTCGDCLLMPLR